MTNHTEVSEKTLKIALKQANYYFICGCGCGQASEELGKEYVRLRKGYKWFSKSCVNGKETVREFKNGVIVKVDDF